MPLLIAVLFLLLPGLARGQDTYEVTAGRAEQIVIDGVLEPAWLRGGMVEGFVQRDPGYPDPASLPTRLWILADEDALYVGFMCYDTAPDSILGRIQRRDNDAHSDFVDVYLDSFHDLRNGYWYTITAAGVQAEGTVANENEFALDWDAVWESGAARCDSGWTCEFRIPFQSIRHGGEHADGWGIAFHRHIERRNESSFWPPVDPRRDFRISEAASLYGIVNIPSAAHIDVLPHAVGRWDAEAIDGEWHSENEVENLGFYLKAVPNGAMTIDFTYQPDFAQVDVDEEVINLSDYPVFFAEKRPFFLENKQIFEELPYYLFYSRRMTDPDYAERLNLQQGRLRASVLAGKNRSIDDKLQDQAVGRVALNLGRVHRVGFTTTHLSQTGYSARAAAVDARLRFRQQDRLLLWLSGVERSGDGATYGESRQPVHDEQPIESRIAYAYDFDVFNSDWAVTYRGTDYDVNDLGYTDYSNVMREAFWVGQNYFPSHRIFRNIGFDVNALTETFADQTHRMGSANFDVYANTHSNWHFGLGSQWADEFYRRHYLPDSVDAEFRDNYSEFNAEYYSGPYFWTWVNSDNRRPLEYHHDLNYGYFRDGDRFRYEPELLWKPRGNLEISQKLSWWRLWSVTDFDSGRVDYQLWITSLRWSPHLNIQVRGTAQYDQTERSVLTNLLFAYNWHPGSWLYLVYDETGRMLSDEQRHRLAIEESRPGNRTLRAKLTYFLVVP